MLRVLCFGLVVAAAVPVSQWKQKHPQAAQALGKWVQENPQASRKVFAWDGLHPDRTKELVDWAISNPDTDIVAFHTKHRDWPEFDELLDKHRGALNELAAWARQHRDAAKDLIENPRGLEWAGKNLYPPRSRQARARPAG